MFVEALKKIYKKINLSEDKDAKLEALYEKISNDANLKAQYESYLFLKENTAKVENKKQLLEFTDKLKNTISKEEETLKKSVKELLEYFNINPNSLKENDLDKALSLNENSIRKVVLNEEKLILKESYKLILREQRENHLKQEFAIVEFLSNAIKDEKKQTLVKESLKSVIAESYKDFNSSTKKLYKLRLVTESLLTEDAKGSVPGKGIIDNMNWTLSGSKIILKFKFPVYPIGKNTATWKRNALQIKSKISNTERTFVSSLLQTNTLNGVIDPVGTIWEVLMRSQIHNSSELNHAVDCRIKAFLTIKVPPTKELCHQIATEAVNSLNKNLASWMGDLSDALTPGEGMNVNKYDFKSAAQSKPEVAVEPKVKKAKKDKAEYFDVNDMAKYYSW